MESARIFLVALGLVFAVGGLAVGWAFDRFAGLALLLVGAFLLFLPLTSSRPDE